MANEFQQANLFQLSDDDIQGTYFSTSVAGSPLVRMGDWDPSLRQRKFC